VLLPEKNDLRWSTIQKRHEKGKADTVGDRKDGEGYPSVTIERVRKLLISQRMASRRGAKECASS
jgi:hypothetical protein